MFNRKEYIKKWRKNNPEYQRKYCGCGCGELAKEGNIFINGHNAKDKFNPMYGKHHSEETRKKISIAEKGKIISDDVKKKMSDMYKGKNNPNYGKHHLFSYETKKRMSEAHKGKYGELSSNWKGGIKLKWKRANDKRRDDLKYQLNSRITRSINSSLKKGIKNHRLWCDLVGYNVDQLKKRLELTMPKDYNWNDFLQGKLHIDHIIPINVFNFDQIGQIDFIKCWALDNLQLLPAKENLIKHNKLVRPFQPALKM